MRLRPYTEADRLQVLRVHRVHGDQYFFADPDLPINFYSVVAEDDGGVVRGILTGRKCVEAILMVDPEVPPVKRFRMIRSLVEQGCADMRREGYDEAHVAVPRQLDGYAELLGRLPWFLKEDRNRFVVPLGAMCDIPESTPAFWRPK